MDNTAVLNPLLFDIILYSIVYNSHISQEFLNIGLFSVVLVHYKKSLADLGFFRDFRHLTSGDISKTKILALKAPTIFKFLFSERLASVNTQPIFEKIF